MKRQITFIISIVALLMVLTTIVSKLDIKNYFDNKLSSSGSSSSKLKGKKILFLGDSLTSLDKVPYEEAIKNPTEPNEKEHYKYIDWVRELTGATCYNYGYAGSTIACITNPKDPDLTSFVSRYKDIVKKYVYPDSFDFIVLFGGINDYMQSAPISNFENADPMSFYGALNETITSLQTAYPKAKIIIMNPLIGFGSDINFEKTANQANSVLGDYRKAIETVAKAQGIIHIPMEQFSGLNPNNQSIAQNFYANVGDGVHPNPEGHKRIAIPLINYLENLVY